MSLARRLVDNRVFRSIVRHGLPDTNRERALIVHQNLFLHLHPARARLRAIALPRTLYLGGLSAACFLILTITGLLLMFYYRPAVPQAYQDMKDLEFVVSWGVFLRNLHRWSAHAMVALVFLHLVFTFYRGAYRPPREFNWALGVGLFVATLLLSYTGYLLPWDQLAFWAVTVGTRMAEAAPLVGERLRFLLLGGPDIGENALLRFYVLHCVALPLAAAVGISVHVWRIRKDRGIYLGPAENTAPGAGDVDEKEEKEPQVMTIPHLLWREVVALIAITALLVAVSVVANAPLEAIANATKTPNPAKAPWYFLGLQELLHYWAPLWSGVIIPGAAVVALAVVPYFTTNNERRPISSADRTKAFAGIWCIVAVATVLLGYTGAHPAWVLIVPTWLIGALASLSAVRSPGPGVAGWIAGRSVAFWVFSWFVVSTVVLTIVGIYFRGPNWALTLPWRDGVYY